MKWRTIAVLLFPLLLGGAALTPIGFNDCSKTITLGGTAQLLIDVNTRSMLLIQNLSTDPLAFSATTTTPAVNTNGSFTLAGGTAAAPGGSYGPNSFALGNGQIWIIGATTGDAFTCHWR